MSIPVCKSLNEIFIWGFASIKDLQEAGIGDGALWKWQTSVGESVKSIIT